MPTSPPRPRSPDPWREQVQRRLRENRRSRRNGFHRSHLPLTGPVEPRALPRYAGALQAVVAPAKAFVCRCMAPGTSSEIALRKSWVHLARAYKGVVPALQRLASRPSTERYAPATAARATPRGSRRPPDFNLARQVRWPRPHPFRRLRAFRNRGTWSAALDALASPDSLVAPWSNIDSFAKDEELPLPKFNIRREPQVMSSSIAPTVYLGQPTDRDSERKFLESSVEWFVRHEIPCVALANFHLGGRQIDCVLATEHGVSVVEVKSSYLQLRGGLNGAWEQFQVSGDWRPVYTNAYQQALAAKNALRDAMNAMKPVGSFYPDGHVVFTSKIAEGSRVTLGDFKVTVTTLDGFLSNFKVRGTAPWSLDDWRAFAVRHALAPASAAEATASPEDRESVVRLKKYNTAFAVEYGEDAGRWLPEDSEQRRHLLVAATTGAGCFVTGPSGCGKTLIAKWVAVELARSGHPTFFFAAKDFAGSWAASLRRELALLSDQRPAAFLRAISRIDRPVFLVLDGINELGSHRQGALRGIRALARHLGAKLIVTAQDEKPSALDGLRTVTVSRPTFDLKRRIAQSGGVALNTTALGVLKAITSGIEAELVGKIGAELKAAPTRLVLIDQYIRMRLGKHGRAGAFGLRRLASRLHEHVAFSLSESDCDEFLSALGVVFEACDALFVAGLLVRRGGRVSFSHEMIQNSCAAFNVAPQARKDPETFGFRLSTPVLKPIAGDCVAAIEDAPTCRGVLEAVTDFALLSAAAQGEFGTIAASIARTLLGEASDACVAETRGARLVLTQEHEGVRLDWGEDGRRDWTPAERARLRAIGDRAASGVDLDAYLNLCAKMDELLHSERRRLADAARRARFPLKSKSFALAYYGFSRTEIGFTDVARASRLGLRELHPTAQELEFSLAKMSSGQLHFILENGWTLFNQNDEGCFADELLRLLRERFRWEPYHVQLALLHAVGFARRVPEETRRRLVEAIESLNVSSRNWGVSSSIIDALKMLGAVDDHGGQTRKKIRRELHSVLVEDKGTVDKDLALTICMNMFDHPYDSIYSEEIFRLSERLRRRLYRRALGAPRIKDCMNLAWLSRQVASFEDASDKSLFYPLATLPSPSHPFPQEEWSGFVVATRFLGRHNAGLPQVAAETEADRCLAEIRTLVHSAESVSQLKSNAARLAWQRLHAMPVQLVTGCLSEVHDALTERRFGEAGQAYQPLDLVAIYATDCLNVARQFVEDGVDAQFYHRVPAREMGPSFAFDTIGRYGDRSDLERLRRFSRAHQFARFALPAMRSLDTVSGAGP